MTSNLRRAFLLPLLTAAVAVVGCNGKLGGTSQGAGGGNTGGGDGTTTVAGTGGSLTTSAGPTTAASTGSTTSSGTGLPAGPSSMRLTMRPIGTVPNAPLGYAEYLPPGYGDGAKRPLLLFHHGIGESGDGSASQVTRVLATGLTALIKNDKWPDSRPFIILAPQHDAPPNTGCHTSEEIDTFAKFAVAHYDVDPKRVYLTGLSCGAIGSWNYLGDHTNELFAAAVLISGDGKGAFSHAGCNLGRIPIWAFHGDMDPTVNDSGSIQPITDLNACTNPAPVDAELTLYPGVGHDAWDRTYDLSAGHDIYTWMLGYTH